jgi:ferritin-like metal-binding protein YciE
MNTLKELLVHELKDLYNAERQLIKALPRMAKAANHGALKTALNSHLDETKDHVRRLERAFKLLDLTPRGTKCDAMQGLIAEGAKMTKMNGDASVLDAGLIAAAQRVEHYEIAAYGCARAFAALTGEDEIADLLQQTLDEESAANETLTHLATSGINDEALHATARN